MQYEGGFKKRNKCLLQLLCNNMSQYRDHENRKNASGFLEYIYKLGFEDI